MRYTTICEIKTATGFEYEIHGQSDTGTFMVFAGGRWKVDSRFITPDRFASKRQLQAVVFNS